MSYNGKILHVNLSDSTLAVEKPEPHFYRTYFGGRNVIAHYLLKGLQPGVDPLGPANRLVFAPGIITGISLPGTGRHSVGAKSPLTGGYAEGEAGGFWGAELKHAGFDAIVVDGRAPEPVYLWLHNGEAEIRPAAPLWGLETGPAEDRIREELGDRLIRTALIGPAGENLARIACVINDRTRAAGRGGLGAVMGSKQLKAVAVRGTQPPAVADSEALTRLSKHVADRKDKWAGFMDTGTAGGVMGLDASGGLPTRNFIAGSFVGAASISGERMRDTILVDRPTCHACPLRCKREVEITAGPWKVDRQYGGPEYETVGALGSLCGIDDLAAIAKGNELCNRYSLDTIAAGNVIAFVMECFERGILTPERSGGWTVHWGDAAGMVEAIEMIAHRHGFGDQMAEGVARLAAWIGPQAEPLAMHVKGQEFPMHEPRIKHGLGLGYAVSPTGADHVHNIHDPDYVTENDAFARLRSLGIPEPLPVHDLTARKVRLFVHEVNWFSLDNCLCMCRMYPGRCGDLEWYAAAVRAATGWNSTVAELEQVGERSVTLTRAFNVREGFSRADDRLPERFFHTIEDSSTGRPLDKGTFEQALTTYYHMMGWDDLGTPTLWKLQDLDLEWVAEELARWGRGPA